MYLFKVQLKKGRDQGVVNREEFRLLVNRKLGEWLKVVDVRWILLKVSSWHRSDFFPRAKSYEKRQEAWTIRDGATLRLGVTSLLLSTIIHEFAQHLDTGFTLYVNY